MKQIFRYHPLLVTLHWVLAVLIIAELTVGFFGLAATPNSDPRKIGILRVHMAGGVLILALMVLRFIVRMRTSRPADATTGYPLLDRIAPISHYGFYVLVLMMVGTGFATAIIAGLGEIVFGSTGAPLPPTLMTYPAFVAHIFFAMLLSSLVVFARACRVLPPVRQKRPIVPADGFRATCVGILGSGGIILPKRRPLPL